MHQTTTKDYTTSRKQGISENPTNGRRGLRKMWYRTGSIEFIHTQRETTKKSPFGPVTFVEGTDASWLHSHHSAGFIKDAPRESLKDIGRKRGAEAKQAEAKRRKDILAGPDVRYFLRVENHTDAPAEVAIPLPRYRVPFDTSPRHTTRAVPAGKSAEYEVGDVLFTVTGREAQHGYSGVLVNESRVHAHAFYEGFRRARIFPYLKRHFRLTVIIFIHPNGELAYSYE